MDIRFYNNFAETVTDAKARDLHTFRIHFVMETGSWHSLYLLPMKVSSFIRPMKICDTFDTLRLKYQCFYICLVSAYLSE